MPAPLLATEGESKPRQLPPAGTHIGRCFSVIDLGTQSMDYMGQSKELRKIRVTWELPDERAVFNEDKGEQPFVLSKDYTLSLYEKANLRHDLESWRGRQFTADELKGFDIFTLLGHPCLLSVIHKTTEGGKTFANVTTVSKLAKGMTCSPQVNPLIRFAVDDGRNEVFETLPKWLQEKIENCAEWNEPVGATTPGPSKSSDGDDDEIPF